MQTGKTVFLGVEGAGKTTLAMALVKAFAKHRDEGWYLRPVDRGAYNFAAVAPEDFVSGHFPRQTANSRELTWRIEQGGREVGGFEILDYPGEVYRLAFLNADDEANPEAVRTRQAAGAAEIETLRKAVENAGRVFVLFNLQDALNLDTNDANRGAVWVTNECLHALKALPSKPQVTLVFTQVDRYADKGDFLHEFTPKDLDLIGHDHADVDWTMVSVLVPPESEFGVDAFVRRCTGLVDFGVASGRPKTTVKPNALDRLRASMPAPEPVSAPAAPAEKPVEAKVEETPEVAKSAEKPVVRRIRRPVTLILVAVLCGVLISTVRLLVLQSQRRQALAEEQAEEQARQKEAEQQKVLAVEKARIEAEIARVAAERKKMEEEAAARRAAEEERARKVEEAKRKAEEERMRQEREAKERAAREKAAAEKVRQEAERAAAEKKRHADEAFREALTKKSPQDAHELLCEAAENGNAAAQYRLACVYDVWGWGGWKPEEGAKVHWSKWMRQIDLSTNSTAVAVSRPAKNAVDFQKLALTWYEAASSNGVAEATAALKRHETEGERK